MFPRSQISHSGVPAPVADLSLTAAVTQSFRIDAIPGLFRAGNDALRLTWGSARRLVVVWDDSTADRGGLLTSYLQSALRGSRLDDFVIVEAGSFTPDPLSYCDLMAEAAAKVQLGRRDAFLVFGDQRTSQLVGIAAASFRRYTRSIRIHRDLAALIATLRNGHQAAVEDNPIGAPQRNTWAIADEDGLRARRRVPPSENLALLVLALLDGEVLVQLRQPGSSRARLEALSALLRLSHRMGPGHLGWRVGEDLRPLAPDTLDPLGRRIWALQLTAAAAGRLGLLGGDNLRELDKVAARRFPGLPQPSTAVAEPDAVHRWLAQPERADADRLTICLPTGSGTAVADLDRSALAAALTLRSPVLTAHHPAAHHPAAHHPATQLLPSRRPAGPRGTQLATGIPADRTSLVSFPVLFADRVLDPGDGTLAGLLPPDGRVLAVVDPYSPGQTGAVTRLLEAYRARQRIRDFAVLPLAISATAKTLTEVRQVVGEAERCGLTADDRFLVVGGGTIMDIVGYASYLYRAQTPYIRVPTTLVGMIDAGVGLKVGVNANGHKNLLGAYHPPIACVCDHGFLRTLPTAELRCGLAEAIKISVVCDRELYELIGQHYRDVLAGRNTPAVRAIVRGSISCMLDQLAANPFEDNVRRLPDFGHEFGHMLESLTRYRLRHGEAVSVGMALSSALAAGIGYLSGDDLRRVLQLLLAVGLDVHDQACDPETLWHKLRDDVLPHKAGQLHLVVPLAIGTGGFIDSLDEISLDLLSDTCRQLRAWNEGTPS
jgi:2-epi-5-epi-valiolone synthase